MKTRSAHGSSSRCAARTRGWRTGTWPSISRTWPTPPSGSRSGSPTRQRQRCWRRRRSSCRSWRCRGAKNFYILQDVRRLTKARGWDVTWPIDKDPVWEIPHLAYLLADDAGKGRQFVDLVYRARWQEGRDVSLRTTVAEIGDELGLDGDRLAAASDDPELRDRGVECLRASWKDGLFGVPFFAYGRDKFFGLDRLRTWVATVRGTDLAEVGVPWWEHEAAPAFSEPGADGGPAGGCA
ncbi:DsbA family protein [Micromonospora sp. M12]